MGIYRICSARESTLWFIGINGRSLERMHPIIMCISSDKLSLSLDRSWYHDNVLWIAKFVNVHSGLLNAADTSRLPSFSACCISDRRGCINNRNWGLNYLRTTRIFRVTSCRYIETCIELRVRSGVWECDKETLKCFTFLNSAASILSFPLDLSDLSDSPCRTVSPIFQTLVFIFPSLRVFILFLSICTPLSRVSRLSIAFSRRISITFSSVQFSRINFRKYVRRVLFVIYELG